MDSEAKRIFRTLNINKIWLPLVLGVGVAAYLLISDSNLNTANLKPFSNANWRYLALIPLAVIARDLGYIYRIRFLTHQKLNWLSSFYIIVLWEFSSAVTPFVVGGSLVATFLLLKEGIKLGESLAYVIVTTIFDSLVYVVATALGFFGAYDTIFASLVGVENSLGKGLQVLFWSSHVFISTYTAIMLLALFVRPTLFQWTLAKLTSISFLKRWHTAALKHGEDIVLASHALKGQKASYWFKIGLITLGIWIARYAVLNLIMATYVSLNITEHLTILGKQVIMWTIMLVSPTPGGSVTAEFFYQKLYSGVLGDYTLLTDLIWRVFTYYFYLVLGAIFLPRWIRRVFATQKANTEA